MNTIMKTRSETFQFGESLEWHDAGKGCRRQIMGYDGQLMVVKVHFEKGAVGQQHSHYHSQASYVVSGKFEVDIEGRKSVVGPGDGYYVEPDQMHGCTCLEEGILLDVFSPQRVDFLK